MDQSAVLVPQTTARRIQAMIRSGELRRGDRLPSQRDLAARLHVSRASLREALSILETLGLLRTEPRRGTRVANLAMDGVSLDGPASQPWRFGPRYSPSEVYQFRFVTEGHAARLAALQRSEEDIAALAQNLREFKEAVRERDLVASSQLDFAFHRLVMAISGNRVFLDLYGSYGSVLLESQRLPLTRRERLWEPVSEHENVVRAVEQGDPDGAGYFMHVHILRAADRVGIALSERT
jgi:GntR family transcriptional regulator, transcriptional repressor for pyruvate dehydrogenase complex